MWKFETGGKVRSSPALSNLGILYVGSDDQNVYALNTIDGTKLWKFTSDGKVSSSVALTAAHIMIPCRSGLPMEIGNTYVRALTWLLSHSEECGRS